MEKQEALSAKQMVALRRYSRIFGPPSVSAAQLLMSRSSTTDQWNVGKEKEPSSVTQERS